MAIPFLFRAQWKAILMKLCCAAVASVFVSLSKVRLNKRLYKEVTPKLVFMLTVLAVL